MVRKPSARKGSGAAKAARARKSSPSGLPRARRKKPETDERFPVVAVGASAGGLEAMKDLLRHLPSDPGSAIILLQHLHADRESMLADILQKSTDLPVRQITAGQKVERNRVYVAPASHDVRLEDGVFALDPKPAMRGREMPIDRLFESIAEHYDVRAVGVVLSGTLSDGALGLRAIKEGGGVTFAQDPTTAAFSEMPRAAVVAGGVDRILSPDRIAREIVRLARHPYMRAPAAADSAVPLPGEEEMSAGRRLFHILRSATGVDFSSYRQSTFQRRVHRRMAVRRIRTLTKYVEFLRANPEEVDALFDDILITVTRFFRDREVFDVLREKVFPSVIANRPKSSPIRIWVPGCSTGEEVYSLAIALLESLQDAGMAPAVQVFATDISENALRKARAGKYLENSMVDVSEERRRNYFVKTPAGWQIAKVVRDICVFARQNVAADPPFSNVDLVSCRNLLIYLDPTLQQRIFPYFHYALKPGGYLLLGRSESIGSFAELFEPFDRGHRIFTRRAVLPRGIGDFGEATFVQRTHAPAAPAPVPLRRKTIHERADRLVLGRYGPPGVVVNAEFDVVQFRGRTTPFFAQGSGSASLNVVKLAREELQPRLREALQQARKSRKRVRREGVRIRLNGDFQIVNLDVAPIGDGGSDGTFYLVLFESPETAARTSGRETPAKPASRGSPRSPRSRPTADTLESELASTKEYLQTIIEEQEASNEELKSANEEILSANEELQSTNEELETAKEELQSTNEELITVNEELQNRNAQLSYAHNDLANVFGINLPIVMIGSDGVIRRFTQPAERIFNMGPQDVGRRFSELRPRLKNIDVSEIVDHVIDTVQPVEREIQDEIGNWFSLRVRPYRTVENRIDGVIVALFDLRTTEQITRSLDYADALVETVRESLLVLDTSLRILSANRSFYRQFRTTPARTEGKTLTELFDLGQRAPELLYLLENVVAEKDPIINHEVEIDFPGLGRRTLIVNARRAKPSGQENAVVLLAVEEITERKWVETGLHASELRYRLLFETAREGIWLLDGSTARIIDVNPFLAEFLGFRRDELIGKIPWEAGLYADPEGARRRFEELIERGFSHDPQVEMRSRSGEPLEIEAVSNVYSVGTSLTVQCSMRDLSERNRLQTELRRVQKAEAIGALASGIAHDFNNLLNIISVHLELLSRADGGRGGEKAKKEESADAIRKTLQRGSSVVKQLLTFARREKPSFESLAVNPLVEEIVGVVRETFPKTIRLETRLAPDLPAIHGDPTQIHQAVLNLLVNARDAMSEGGTVTVRTSRASGDSVRERVPEAEESDYVELDVADEGSGMDEEARKRVFEPFFTTRKSSGGQGVGLAVVQMILQAHGAHADVESRPGEGTTFRLFFPAVKEREKSPRFRLEADARGTSRNVAESGSAEAGSGAKSRTILLVEDEELLRKAVSSLLEQEGYRVLVARDGEEAIKTHAAHQADIAAVILDLGLPKLDGWEAYLQMKKRDPTLKGIVASGNLGREKRVEMRKNGVQASLRKPYAPEEILKTLREVLERP